MNNSYPERILYKAAKLIMGIASLILDITTFLVRGVGVEKGDGGRDRKRKTEEKVHSVDLPIASIWVNV